MKYRIIKLLKEYCLLYNTVIPFFEVNNNASFVLKLFQIYVLVFNYTKIFGGGLTRNLVVTFLVGYHKKGSSVNRYFFQKRFKTLINREET